ncbi:MAG: hypothetical protein AAF921_19315 [Cyanobacteria bacterium P01_D01_bin.44]
MNDPMLAERLAKVNALLTAPCDDAWIAETTRIEGDGWIEAGPRMQPYVETLKSMSPEAIRTMRRQMRIQSILMPELCQWLESWGLGLSFEAVYTEARRVVRRHLKQLTPEQEAWLDALVVEDDQYLPMAERTLRSQVVALFSTLFTEADWQSLADIAAQGMAQGVLQVAQKKETSSIAV